MRAEVGANSERGQWTREKERSGRTGRTDFGRTLEKGRSDPQKNRLPRTGKTYSKVRTKTGRVQVSAKRVGAIPSHPCMEHMPIYIGRSRGWTSPQIPYRSCQRNANPFSLPLQLPRGHKLLARGRPSPMGKLGVGLSYIFL